MEKCNEKYYTFSTQEISAGQWLAYYIPRKRFSKQMSMIFQFCVTPKISQSIIGLTVVIAIIPYDLSRLSDDKYNNMKFIYNFSDFNKFDYSKYTENQKKYAKWQKMPRTLVLWSLVIWKNICNEPKTGN